MRTQISKPEYALVTVAVAQKLTGSRSATPTAKQLAEAQKQVKAAVLKAGLGVKGGTTKVDKLFDKARSELSGISGMSGIECGGLWDDIKALVIKAAPAMPFVGPAAGLLAASAPLMLAKGGKKSPPGAPPTATPAGAPPAASASPSTSASTSTSTSSPDDVAVVGGDM